MFSYVCIGNTLQIHFVTWAYYKAAANPGFISSELKGTVAIYGDRHGEQGGVLTQGGRIDL